MLVEQLWWWRSGEGKLVSVMATAALGAEAAAAVGKERRPRKWNGERGAVWAGAGEVKARAGLPWPHAAGRR